MFLDTIATVAFLCIILGSIVIPPIALAAFLFDSNLKWLTLTYMLWFFWDYQSSKRGYYPENMSFRNWVRSWGLWPYVKAYFPAKLVRTVKLDSKKNYIMGYHPHGFIFNAGLYVLSLFINVLLGNEWNTLFPGVKVRTTTLPVNFYIPFWREFCFLFGTMSCDKRSIKKVLNQKKDGTCIAIAIGGAKEFMKMKAGEMDLVIQKRKGFAKIALETGSDLLPVLGFGENEIYSKLDNILVRIINKFTMIFKFAAPIFVGRGITLVPRKHPLVTVVGRPISVKRIENPTEKDIDELHAKYLSELKNLYEANKDKYHSFRKRDMQFI
jgi:2-acylglycerol O-acyltransferase 2